MSPGPTQNLHPVSSSPHSRYQPTWPRHSESKAFPASSSWRRTPSWIAACGPRTKPSLSRVPLVAVCLTYTEVSSFKLYYVTISTLLCDAFNHLPCKHINALGTFPEISIWSSYRSIIVTRPPPPPPPHTHTQQISSPALLRYCMTFKHLGMNGHQCATILPQKQANNTSPKSSPITLPKKQANNTPQKAASPAPVEWPPGRGGHTKVQDSSSHYTLPSLCYCVTHSKQDIFHACTSRWEELPPPPPPPLCSITRFYCVAMRDTYEDNRLNYYMSAKDIFNARTPPLHDTKSTAFHARLGPLSHW